jgi:uncharacterized membrane protein YbhN (UPF0104 family)
MPPDDEGATHRSRTRNRLVSLVGSAVGLIGMIFVTRILVSEGSTLASSFRAATVWLLIASIPLGALGMGWIGFQWNGVITALGGRRVAWPALFRSYYVGQLGKYVPGGVWPVIGRAELLARFGTGRRIAYPSVGLSMVTTYLGAVLLAAAASPFALASSANERSWFLLTLPVGFAALHPAVLGRIIGVGERFFSKGEPTTVPPWGTAVALVVRHVPAWLLISATTYVVARSMHIDVGFAVVLFATPLAWGAGLVAVPVPGGIGVRESVFVALVASSAGAGEAAALAITSRAIFIIADVLAAAIAALVVPAPPRATT